MKKAEEAKNMLTDESLSAVYGGAAVEVTEMGSISQTINTPGTAQKINVVNNERESDPLRFSPLRAPEERDHLGMK